MKNMSPKQVIPDRPIRLIVNADDFGVSESVNSAVELAHRSGVLTTTSLMTGARAFDHAVEIAKRNPQLGVGLHLTLVKGLAVSKPEEIPDLVDEYGNLPRNEIGAGFRYFFNNALVPQLEREIETQFEKFRQTGLQLDHVNGHLHFHLHPAIFRILQKNVARFRFTRFRLVREPLLLNLRYNRQNLFSKLVHWATFQILSQRAGIGLSANKIRTTGHTFGLLETGRMDEDYFFHLVQNLSAETSEIYFHPDTAGPGKQELDALISPRIRKEIEKRKIRQVCYSEL